MAFICSHELGTYFGFRHMKYSYSLDDIKEVGQYEIAKDPNVHNYLRIFKILKNGSKASKSLSPYSEGLCLFKDKFQAQEYLRRCKDEYAKDADQFLERTRKNIVYLDGITF